MSAARMVGSYLACAGGAVQLESSRGVELSPIPVIDFRRLRKHFKTRSVAASDIGRACEKFGCFQVVNHGISRSITNSALEAASGFFELPSEEKAEFASDDVRKAVRYEGARKEGGRSCNSRQFLKQYAHPLGEWIHCWPQNPPEYRERMGRFAAEVRVITLQLLCAILQSLGLSQTDLRDKLDVGAQLVAVNCYPAAGCTRRRPAVGLAPHTDYGLITVILQSCEGLQIADLSGDGESWRPAAPVGPGTLHVHVGDHLEVLSNGRYKSLLHRAVLGPRRRISIASIFCLAMDEKVGVAKELVDEQHPEKYNKSSFRDFLDYISVPGNAGGSSFIESLKIIRD